MTCRFCRSLVWCQRATRYEEEKREEDRKVYIITDLATAGPGPTLG